MFFDEIQIGKTRPDVFSRESLIAWLEKMPGAREYNYDCNGRCLLALYFIAHGFGGLNVGGYTVCYNAIGEDDRQERDLPKGFNDIAVNQPWTFSAALARARTAL